MKVFQVLFAFLLHLGYAGPLVMGVLDSSFLVLPFGNDLLIVWLVAHRHAGAAWYVLSAAVGSTLGALILCLVARKLGEAGIRKIAGRRNYDKLCKRVSHSAWLAVGLGALAPPPFPYTVVVAATAALGRPLFEILLANFIGRALRFALLAWLALEFGDRVTAIMNSAPFRWTVIGFVILGLILSAFSVWKWLHHVRGSGKQTPAEQTA